MLITILLVILVWFSIGASLLLATCYSPAFDYWLFNEGDRIGNADGWWTVTAKIIPRLFAFSVLLAIIIPVLIIGGIVNAPLL